MPCGVSTRPRHLAESIQYCFLPPRLELEALNVSIFSRTSVGMQVQHSRWSRNI